jgi:hypothetical protein
MVDYHLLQYYFMSIQMNTSLNITKQFQILKLTSQYQVILMNIQYPSNYRQSFKWMTNIPQHTHQTTNNHNRSSFAFLTMNDCHMLFITCNILQYAIHYMEYVNQNRMWVSITSMVQDRIGKDCRRVSVFRYVVDL